MNTLLERQLLLQLGDRLKRLRKAQKLGTVEMAARAGIARNTLRAIETGDPGTSMGTYLRVMSVLGISGELALLAGDAMNSSQSPSVSVRSRREVQVHIAADTSRHQLQDLQSLALHEEAVRMTKANPQLALKAKKTVERWLATGDACSASLWREWLAILDAKSWRKILVRTQRAHQLRQTSPLVTILPVETRERILKQAGTLKNGVMPSNSGARRQP